MPQVPAICEKCGKIFASRVSVGARNITFTDCPAGPCPRCGGSGSIPDGAYSAISETVLSFKAGRVSAAGVRRLVSILEASREQEADTGQTASRIRTEVPELSSLADVLPQTRGQLYAFIAIVIAALTLLANTCRQDGTESAVSVHKLIVNVYQQQSSSAHDRGAQ